MQQKTIHSAIVAALLAAAQAPAHAVDTGIDWLTISGFGTLAMTRANIDKAELAYYNPSATASGGAQDEWTGGVDSRLGVQFGAKISSQLSATVQILTRKDAEGSYRPKAEWANLKYQITPDIAVRVGRVGLPIFMVSDYLNVGYSQPWLRPPVDGYKQMPMTHLDGADATFRFNAGDTTISFQPGFGTNEYDAPIAGGVSRSKNKRVMVANVVVENGYWTGRYANVRSDVTNDVQLPGLTIKDNFSNVGVAYDNGSLLVQSEYIWRKTNDVGFIVGQVGEKMGYITTGYRFGKVMPSITYSRFLDGSTTGVFGTSQDTIGLGVRWDFYKNMALKGQWDRIERGGGRSTLAAGVPGATGLFGNAVGSPFSATDKKVNVLAVGLDFVF